jgi:hypothetical protein
LTPIKFLIIFPIRSSLYTTISWPMNLILHGFVPNTAVFGSLPSRRFVKKEGSGLRGRTSEDQGSLGPGMKRKCEPERMGGNSVIRSPKAVKPSGRRDHGLLSQLQSHIGDRYPPLYASISTSLLTFPLVKLPHKTKTFGITSASTACSNSLLRPLSVLSSSSRTSDMNSIARSAFSGRCACFAHLS